MGWVRASVDPSAGDESVGAVPALSMVRSYVVSRIMAPDVPVTLMEKVPELPSRLSRVIEVLLPGMMGLLDRLDLFRVPVHIDLC